MVEQKDGARGKSSHLGRGIGVDENRAVVWLREGSRQLPCGLLGIFQLCCTYEKKLQCFVAKGGDREMKTDAAGCWRNSQAIYTHNPFHPIVRITGFWFLNDL